jgi:enterochelin esterase-like enzyme
MTLDGDYPTIYVTDGPEYIQQGKMVSIMDRLITKGKMKPVIAVFVDARNPDDLRITRRNKQYSCKEGFAKFFVSEMIATIENKYPVRLNKQDRVIQGASMGGLNAACFGIMVTNEFADYPCIQRAISTICVRSEKNMQSMMRFQLRFL